MLILLTWVRASAVSLMASLKVQPLPLNSNEISTSLGLPLQANDMAAARGGVPCFEGIKQHTVR